MERKAKVGVVCKSREQFDYFVVDKGTERDYHCITTVIDTCSHNFDYIIVLDDTNTELIEQSLQAVRPKYGTPIWYKELPQKSTLPKALWHISVPDNYFRDACGMPSEERKNEFLREVNDFLSGHTKANTLITDNRVSITALNTPNINIKKRKYYPSSI